MKTNASDPPVDVCQRPVEMIERARLGENDVVVPISIPSLDMCAAKPSIACDVDENDEEQ